MTNQLNLKTFKTISSQFALTRNLQKIGSNSILEDTQNSQYWLIDPQGIKLRTICGYRDSIGKTCLRSAGSGTTHGGYGKCKQHDRNLFFNINLSLQHNMPTRLSELLEMNSKMEEIMFNSVDPEIIKLESLVQYIMTSPREEEGEISLEEINLIKDLVKEIVKAKVTRVKILKEMRLDTTLIKDFVGNILKVVALHVPGPVARKIYNDIVNSVLIPFKNKDQFDPSEIKGASEEKLEKVLGTFDNKE